MRGASITTTAMTTSRREKDLLAGGTDPVTLSG
jgi:hypothetical protein